MQKLTMMFENSEYQETIDKINKIRSYGLSAMIKVPQIAIVGDQSSGKSSVLEAITKLSFPRNIETCTRAQISEKVLEITISGPELSPLTIIDLPGYINTTVDGQDKGMVQKIHAINTRYIQDSRTIILAVVPANVDLNNIYVLGEAERYDRNNERTIPIVTKPDTVEPDLLPSLIQTLQNKKKHMRLGYLVMRNSSYKDINLSWEEARQREEEFFRSSSLWDQVPNANKGRESVKKFLGNVLYTHIKGELPSLKEDIKKLQHELRSFLDGGYSLDYISEHMSGPASTTAAGNREISTNGDNNDDLLPLPTADDKPCVRSTLASLYERYSHDMNRSKHMVPKGKIGELMTRYRGNELPGSHSFTTFTMIYKETLVHWRNTTKDHVSKMYSELHDATASFIGFTADPLLKDLLQLEFGKFYGLQVRKIEDTIKHIFDDESLEQVLLRQHPQGQESKIGDGCPGAGYKTQQSIQH
ncbi:hypothetical protein BGX26_012104 [Mortierella sp. AD094]|nr:hypothetical protein BGX26_012104 [Mortierella sp. AD094]